MSIDPSNGNHDEALWHYAVGNDKRGPVSHSALGKLLASGEISSETYVWQPGMDNWVHLGEAEGLSALVSGMSGALPSEAFVEEDTTFMPSEQLQAAHQQLGADGADPEMSQDTVVESIESVFGKGGLGAAAQSFMDADKPVAPAPAASKPDAGEDIFAAAASQSSPFGDDDDQQGGGVHGRRQSSVLFTLDDLGREQSSQPQGSDAFVTDSSGLIDIRAVATSAKPAAGDPFSGANLVIPPRAAGAPLSVPLVGRRRGAGPWIFASVALLLIGVGVILVLVLGKDKTEPAGPGPAVVAAADEAAAKKAEEEAAAAKKAEEEAAAAKKAEEEAAAKKAEEEAAAAKKAEEEAKAAAEAATTETEEKVAEAKAAAPKTVRKPTTTTTTTSSAGTTTPKTEAVVKAAPAPKPSSGTNTAKVENLLAQLDGDGGGSSAPKSSAGADSDLPSKLSAAAVRSAIRGRFDPCGAKVSGGSVTLKTSFVISASGVVQSARITDAGGTGSDVQACVVQQLKSTTFGKFKESTMTVNLPVRLP